MADHDTWMVAASPALGWSDEEWLRVAAGDLEQGWYWASPSEFPEESVHFRQSAPPAPPAVERAAESAQARPRPGRLLRSGVGPRRRSPAVDGQGQQRGSQPAESPAGRRTAPSVLRTGEHAMDPSVNPERQAQPALAERQRKLAKIEELVRAEESEGLGLVRYLDSDRTCAEENRRRMLAALDADPSWEPPQRWYTNDFARRYGLPTSAAEEKRR